MSEIADQYDCFFVDIWGVLHDGQKAYPGAANALAYLKGRGKKILLLSNSPNRSSRVVEKVLRPIGVPDTAYDHILTSGEAAHHYMKVHHDGRKVYIFWDEEHPTALESLHIARTANIDEADFIYASLLPYHSNADDYADILARAFARKIPIICGNPDRVVGHGNALHVCVGALAEAYERMGGPVVWFGKPYKPMYEQAWDIIGKPDIAKILAVGDALLTDVGGAVNFGCDVIWNVEGIHWDELQTNQKIDPEKMKLSLEGNPQPTYLMHGFKS